MNYQKMENEDFMEEEIWANNFIKEREVKSQRRVPLGTSPRLIPRANYTQNWEVEIDYHNQSSDPVKIPDWPNKKQKLNNVLEEDKDVDGWGGGKRLMYFGHDEDDEENSNEMVPPHEFIARRLARTRIASFSMCEGIGRTLKGRDLSKVRNSILSKTGFLE